MLGGRLRPKAEFGSWRSSVRERVKGVVVGMGCGFGFVSAGTEVAVDREVEGSVHDVAGTGGRRLLELGDTCFLFAGGCEGSVDAGVGAEKKLRSKGCL